MPIMCLRKQAAGTDRYLHSSVPCEVRAEQELQTHANNLMMLISARRFFRVCGLMRFSLYLAGSEGEDSWGAPSQCGLAPLYSTGACGDRAERQIRQPEWPVPVSSSVPCPSGAGGPFLGVHAVRPRGFQVSGRGFWVSGRCGQLEPIPRHDS